MESNFPVKHLAGQRPNHFNIDGLKFGHAVGFAPGHAFCSPDPGPVDWSSGVFPYLPTANSRYDAGGNLKSLRQINSRKTARPKPSHQFYASVCKFCEMVPFAGIVSAVDRAIHLIFKMGSPLKIFDSVIVALPVQVSRYKALWPLSDKRFQNHLMNRDMAIIKTNESISMYVNGF